MNDVHNQLLDMMDDGIITSEWLAQRCMAWMGEWELQKMVTTQPDFRESGLFEDDEEE